MRTLRPGAASTGGTTTGDTGTTGGSRTIGGTGAPRQGGPSRWRVFTVARGAALVAGMLPALAFPQPGLDWLVWVALVPGLLLARSAPAAGEAALRGWWFGAGYLIAMLHWLVPNIGPGLLLVALAFGALWSGWGVAAWALITPAPGRWGWRWRWAAAPVVVPSVWLVIELVRSWAALGGPWALLGASQWRHPAVLQLAALGGVWLVGFMIVAANVAVALAVTVRPLPARAAAALLAAAAIVVGPLLFALSHEPPVARTVRLALVQPGLTRGPVARFDRQERMTAALPPRTYDLVVWGESSVGFDLDRRPDLVSRLTVLSNRLSAPLLVNMDAQNAAGRISKAALMIGPAGIEARYVKNRLVPFGEYIPFRDGLGWLRRISRAADQDRVPGTGVTVMPVAGITVGPLICFESAFPDLARVEVRRGAAVIVYQSATSTFQQSWGPEQHAALGALRAAETGRPVVQAALTGVSAAYDPRGRRLAWLGTDRRGVTDVRLPIPATTRSTPYVRHGDVVPVAAAAITALAAVIAVAVTATAARAGARRSGT